MGKQIKSKKRVSEHGEVFTSEREVNAMLDLVQEELKQLKSTVLEPACGTGNFLVEILKRKMDTVQSIYHSQHDYELCSLLVFSTIYGLDIQKDNVLESRKRLLDWFTDDYVSKFQSAPSKQLQTALKFILLKNIQCADSLSMKNEKKQPLMMAEWTLCDDGRMIRKDVYYEDLVNGIEDHYIKAYSYRWMCHEHIELGGLVFKYV